jgi:hypothetical protein
MDFSGVNDPLKCRMKFWIVSQFSNFVKICKTNFGSSNIVDFFTHMQNGFSPWISALGGVDWWKNRGSKISCNCPFKYVSSSDWRHPSLCLLDTLFSCQYPFNAIQTFQVSRFWESGLFPFSIRTIFWLDPDPNYLSRWVMRQLYSKNNCFFFFMETYKKFILLCCPLCCGSSSRSVNRDSVIL